MIFYNLKYKLPNWTPGWFDTIIFSIDAFTWRLVHRFVPRYQYHIIRTGLKPDYYDVDTLIEASLVALLNRYVEDENDGEFKFEEHIRNLYSDARLDEQKFPDTNISVHIRNQAKREEQILDLYRWFKYELKRLKKQHQEKEEEFGRLLNRLLESHESVNFSEHPELRRLMDEATKLDQQIYETTTTKLKEIIDFRGSMWT